MGELTTQISGLIGALSGLSRSMERLEDKFSEALDNLEAKQDADRKDLTEKLNASDKETLALKIKVGFIALSAGTIGSILIPFLQRLTFKLFSL